MPEPSSYLESPPSGRARRRIVRFLGAVLALQLLVPFTYYVRSDPYDERFAWRMFSAVRLHRCATTATETLEGRVREIPLGRTIHQAWANHLSRNRRDVVIAFLRRRCEEPGVTEVEVRNACTTPSGVPLAAQVYTRDCATAELSLPRALQVAP